MKKLKKIASAFSIAFLDTVANSTSDPQLKLFLTATSYAVLIPYAVFRQLYEIEAEETLREILISVKNKEALFNSPEFQQAVGNLFDSLRKLKEIERRDLVRRAFTGAYITEYEYTKSHLDRMQDVSERISIPCLQHLSFIKREILPLLKKDADVFASNPQAGYTPEDFKMHKMSTISISKFYDEYYQAIRRGVETDFNRNSNNDTRRAYDLNGADEQKTRLRFLEFYTELNTLGILRQGNDPAIGTFGGGSGTVQYLTKFGREFINYVSMDVLSISDYTHP